MKFNNISKSVKLRRVISLIIFIILFFSSFSILFVFANITSLNTEFDDYLNGAPYALNIKIGELGYYARKIPYVYEGINQLNNLIYFFSGEADLSAVNTPETEVLQLTESEASEILKSKEIKSYFYFNKSESIFRWTIQAPLGQGLVVYPLSPDYLKSLHPPLKEGRYYEESDPYNVILIAEDLSKEIFKGEGALGKNITVYTNKGTEQFKIIGILSQIPASYLGTMDVPFPSIIPYRATEISSYIRGDNKKIYLQPNLQLWIIPEEGKENQLLGNINKILGKDKFDNIVTCSKWEFENSFGVRIRRERIANIALSSILTIVIGIMTIIIFIYFDISSKKREIGIKRSAGATIFQISGEYSSYVLKLLILSFPFSVLAMYFFLSFFTKYNVLGYYTSSNRSLAEVLTLKLNISSIAYSSVLIFLTIFVVSTLFVYKSLREPPAYLLKFFEEKRRRSYIINLAAVTALSVTIIFTSLSMIATIRKTTNELSQDISVNALRVGSRSTVLPFQNTAIYDFEDYKAVKEKLHGKALVGFRIAPPYLSDIYQDSQTFKLRVSGATEDFLGIYDLKLNEGRFLKDSDIGKCVVGINVAKEFALNLGNTFLGNEVIGILEEKSLLIDRTVYVPVLESIESFSPAGLPSGILLVKPLSVSKEEVLNETLDILESRHPGKSRGGMIDISQVMGSIIYSREGVYIILFMFSLFSFLSALLYLSATFLIEGIRRTKEIGIKRAIGAYKREIMKEFLLKGIRVGVISLIIGISAGLIVTFFITKRDGVIFYLSPVLLLEFIFAYVICLTVFSYIPARHASNVTPIEALRRE